MASNINVGTITTRPRIESILRVSILAFCISMLAMGCDNNRSFVNRSANSGFSGTFHSPMSDVPGNIVFNSDGTFDWQIPEPGQSDDSSLQSYMGTYQKQGDSINLYVHAILFRTVSILENGNVACFNQDLCYVQSDAILDNDIEQTQSQPANATIPSQPANVTTPSQPPAASGSGLMSQHATRAYLRSLFGHASATSAVLDKPQSSIAPFVSQANDSFDKHSWDDAVLLYEEALATPPPHGAASVNGADSYVTHRISLAFEYEGMGDKNDSDLCDAERNFRQSIQFDPANKPAVALLTQVLHEENETDTEVQVAENPLVQTQSMVLAEPWGGLAINYPSFASKGQPDDYYQGVSLVRNVSVELQPSKGYSNLSQEKEDIEGAALRTYMESLPDGD